MSVIIPVFGVEKYIERCARSLFEQTLDDIEFIFVNDCTKDNSMSVLEKVMYEYPYRKDQIKIINHEINKGLPTARMSGVKVATGEYIAHCDSDDWADLDLYEKVYELGVKTKADVIISDTDTTDGIKHNYQSGGYKKEPKDCIIDFMHRKMWWSVWHIFYKRSIYKNIINVPFDSMGEDMCFTLQYFYYCKSIAYLHDTYYHYYLSSESIIRNQTEDKCLAKFEQLCRNVDKVKEFYSLQNTLDDVKRGLRYLEFNARYPLLPLLGQEKYNILWKNSYRNCDWLVVFDKYAKPKERFKGLLSAIGLYPIKRFCFHFK